MDKDKKVIKEKRVKTQQEKDAIKLANRPPKTSTSLKYMFKSLISNQAAIDNRNMKWWLMLILLVLTIFLPWISYLGKGYTANAADVLTKANTNEVATSLKHLFSEEEYFSECITVKKDSENKYYLNMNFDKKIDPTNEGSDFKYIGLGSDAKYSWTSEFNATSDKKLFRDTYSDKIGAGANNSITKPTNMEQVYYFDSIGQTLLIEKSEQENDQTVTKKTRERRTYLQAYYFPNLSRNDRNCKMFLTNFAQMVILQKSASGTPSRAPTSYSLLLKDYLEINIFPFNLTTGVELDSATSKYTGNVEEGLKQFDNIDDKSLKEVIMGSSSNVDDAYKTTFTKMLTAGGKSYNITKTWIDIGIISAITAGILVVGTLLMFFFYKRKTSLYREANIYSAFTTAVSLSFTPSLLCMIFGFVMPQMSFMIYIGAALVRFVFVMNKICPSVQQEKKPLYQARD